MKNRTFLIWGILTLVVLSLSVFINSRQAIICWDGIDVDEQLLDQLCGLTREEYFSDDFNLDDCPQALNAVQMIGGCETDWATVWVLTGMVTVVYLLLSAVFFIIRWLMIRKKVA